jgi:hypothetical protein
MESMTNEQIIKACAELDGWKDVDINKLHKPWLVLGDRPTFYGGEIKSYTVDMLVPSYLTSYDAIIPLIQKQSDEIRGKAWGEIISINPKAFDESPRQLCEALLRATGKWIE